MTAAPWHCDPDAPMGERIAQVAISVLAGGMLSAAKRTSVWVAFAACGGKEKLIPIKGTTCAVFAGAVLHWAGRAAKLPRYPAVGATTIGTWLNGLTRYSKSWRPWGHAECVPEPGAITYVEADSNPLNNHVVVLCLQIAPDLEPDLWLCAEGGGGADGSEVKFTVRRWGETTWDSRRLRGLWLPNELDGVGDPPAPEKLPDPAFPLGPGSNREDVKRWQDRLISVFGPSILPKYGADGGWGTETFAATVKAQKAYDLPETGRVDRVTWEALGP